MKMALHTYDLRLITVDLITVDLARSTYKTHARAIFACICVCDLTGTAKVVTVSKKHIFKRIITKSRKRKQRTGKPIKQVKPVSN